MKDFYAILGVQPNASQAQIREKYRFLAKAFHPDVNPSPAAKEAMAGANEAYEVLGDPKKRRAYDLQYKVREFMPKSTGAAPGQFDMIGIMRGLIERYLPESASLTLTDIASAKLREWGIDPNAATPEQIARACGLLAPVPRKRRGKRAS